GGSFHPAERFTRREVDRASETRKNFAFCLHLNLESSGLLGSCVPTWIFSILHVGISKYPRGKGKFSTWGRNETSEESNDMSEEFFLAYVENKKYPRGDLKISTWIFV
uniref:hypothetical protein n=2 Tax=Porphyromonas asaccharolytica TaxID=28123 RepID=UPI00248E7152